MSYCGYVTTIKELRKHSNADRLQVATLFGNDVIVGLDTKVGDVGVYFPTDGKLGEKFATELKLKQSQGGYLDDKKLQIKTIRLRGEQSDGLYVPIKDFAKFANIADLKEGDQITTLKGVLICEKYVPKGKANKGLPNQKKDIKKSEKKNLFPFFEQHIDTAQLAYNTAKFKEGDLVYLTLKLHGTSQRTAHTLKYSKRNKLMQFLIGDKKSWDYVTGTRRVTLENFEGGYYSDNAFREQWHNFFKDKLHKGEEVFYEVVGYTDNGGLIMPECDNGKTKDKQFIKEFGDKTQFTYGCPVGQSAIYVYRMNVTNEDGHVVEYPTELVKLRCEQMGVNFVPVLDKFIFTTKEDLMKRVNAHVDGADPIGKTHIREGVIARIENREKFTALKQKSFNFKVLEGIIKESDVLDIEEADSEGVVIND